MSEVSDFSSLPQRSTVKTESSLQDKVVLVVGACGTHGRSAALAAARAGAIVVLAGRRVPALEQLYDQIREIGQEPAIYPINLEGAHPEDFQQLGSTLKENLGGLDGLVFAAGRLHGLSSLEHIEAEEWLRTWHVLVNAPFLLLRGCRQAMGPHSTAVIYLDDPNRVQRALWGAYGVAQGAAQALVRVAGDEAGSRGPKVTGLVCAPTAGPLMQKAYPARAMSEFADPKLFAPACTWLLEGNGESGQIYDARSWASE